MLDPRTVIVIGSSMALLMTLVLFFMRRSYPASIGGLKHWIWAPFLSVLAGAFFALRDFIPELLSILGGNLLLYWSSFLFYAASQRYYGHRPRPRPWLLLMAVMLFGLLLLDLIDAHASPRVLVVNLALLSLFAAHATFYMRLPQRSFGAWFMLVVLTLQALVLALRVVSVWLGAVGDSPLDPSLLQTLFVASYVLTVLALSIGAMLMVTDALRAKFEQLVAYDALTGALSRSAWLSACQRELDRSQRHQRPLSVLMVDLDFFKNINDSHGHAVGDQVLIDFVTRGQGQLRAHDSLGRLGGEEFVVLLPETGIRAASFVAERIRSEVDRPRLGLPDYTVSVGVASTEETDQPDSVQSLVERADQSMYRAKALGRNRTGWMSL